MSALAGVNFSMILDIVEDALAGNTRPAAVQAIVAFASGKDGILGTSDDRMTPATLELLKKMIEDGSVDRLVERLHKMGVCERLFKCCGS